MATKLKVGFYAITGCQGCLLSFIFNEAELPALLDIINIKAFPFIKSHNTTSKVDIAFMEGVVCSNDDLKTLKKVRNNSIFLVALGACSCTGCLPSYRNFIPDMNYKRLLFKKEKHISDLDPKPIDAYVKVDCYIPGCPPDKHELLTVIKDLIHGKKPKSYTHSVCVECKLNSNYCLLEENKLCLGPITSGGCNSVCTNTGYECWGCRGPTDDANFKEHITLLKDKGFSEKQIKDRMNTFVGMKLKEIKNSKNWLE